MEISHRRKRGFNMFELTSDTDIFGIPSSRSMYSDVIVSSFITKQSSKNTETTRNITNTIDDEYLAAAARLAPFLPLQLRIPPYRPPKKSQTRRRDWWATQKRRRHWRRNPTRKRVAYLHRRTFRHRQ